MVLVSAQKVIPCSFILTPCRGKIWAISRVQRLRGPYYKLGKAARIFGANCEHKNLVRSLVTQTTHVVRGWRNLLVRTRTYFHVFAPAWRGSHVAFSLTIFAPDGSCRQCKVQVSARTYCRFLSTGAMCELRAFCCIPVIWWENFDVKKKFLLY